MSKITIDIDGFICETIEQTIKKRLDNYKGCVITFFGKYDHHANETTYNKIEIVCANTLAIIDLITYLDLNGYL